MAPLLRALVTSTLSASTRGVLAMTFAAALSACAGGVAPLPTPEPEPAPPRVVEAPRPTRALLALRHDTARYEVTSTARVTRDSAGVPVTEEIVTRARVAFSLERLRRAASDPAPVLNVRSTGRVDGFTITASERVAGARSSALPGVATAPAAPQAPLTLPFDAVLDGLNARVAPRPALANECDRPEMSALALVRELLVRLPAELVVGAAWSDTARTFMCRGGVPVVTQTTATATVVSLDDGPLGSGSRAVIERRLVTRVEGQLTTAWRTVGLTGQGTGTQRLVVDAVAGVLTELRHDSELAVDVRDSVRPDAGQQALVQRVVFTARLVP